MIEFAGTQLVGFLLEWRGRPVTQEQLLKCPGLTFESRLRESSWEQYTFHSPKPLRGELAESASDFAYLVICRRSGPRLLLVSQGRSVVDHLILRELGAVFVPRLEGVSVAVDLLVRDLTRRPGEYSLGYVHARLPAFGTALKSAS